MGALRTCKKEKRVPSIFGGTVRRCADYTIHRSPYGKRRKRRGRKKGKRPYNKGRKCKVWGKRYDARSGGVVQYCVSFGADPAWRKKRKRARAATNVSYWNEPHAKAGVYGPLPKSNANRVRNFYQASQRAAERWWAKPGS